MRRFFAEKKIRVEYEAAGAPAGKPQVVFMRPLKINELPRLMRFIERWKAGGVPAGDIAPADFLELISIVGATVEGVNDLPFAVFAALVEVFYDFNFPKPDPDVVVPEDGWFARLLDSLVSLGHRHAEIMEYTLPQFGGYIDSAVERLGRQAGNEKRQKVDPFDALAALGVPVMK